MSETDTNKYSSNKRIAKNTGILYIRQLLTLGLSLYTSRLTLEVLGETNFGIYATVAGFTALLSTLTTSLASGTQRFITFELGKGDMQRLNRVYCTSINIHVILSVLLIVLGEIFGTWFIFNEMTIPSERTMTAFIVFQFTILNCVYALINAPNNAEIIAHEDMEVLAFTSIFDAVLKCVAVIFLFFIEWDHLLVYSFSLFFIQFLIRTINAIWCKKKYVEARYCFIWDKHLTKSMLGVTGWTGLNHLAVTGFIQGVNLLLNIFFGPVLNAAYTIAIQAYSGIRQFCSSFQLASNPQIVKLYSIGELERMQSLLFSVCKLSFFLIFILAFPFIVNAHFVLSIWLNEVPAHTEEFFVLLLLYAFVDVLAYPLDIAAQATGKLKNYSIFVSVIVLSTLIFSYITFTFNAIPETIYYIAIIVSWIGLATRIAFLKNLIGLNGRSFLKNVVNKILTTGLAAAILPLFLSHYMVENTLNATILFLVSLISSFTMIFLIGLTESEKEMVIGILNKIISKIK